MKDSDFSDDFCKFLQTTIESVDAAEFLLLLSAQPDERLLVDQARARLTDVNMTTADAIRYAKLFQTRGLVEIGPDQRVQYRPSSDLLAEHVRLLRQAYNERPVTLVRVIYALRDHKIRSFAEAFNLKKN